MNTVIHPLVLFTISETLTRSINSNVGVLLCRPGPSSCAVVASFPLVLSEGFDTLEPVLKEFSVVYPGSQFYGFYYVTSDTVSENLITTQIQELYYGTRLSVVDSGTNPVMRFDKAVFEDQADHHFSETGSEIPFVHLFDLATSDPIEFSVRSFASEKVAIDGITHHLKDSSADSKSNETKTLLKLDTAVSDIQAFLSTLRSNVDSILEHLYKVKSGKTRKDDNFLKQLATVLDKIERLSRDGVSRDDSRVVQKLKDEIGVNLSLALAQVELIERQI